MSVAVVVVVSGLYINFTFTFTGFNKSFVVDVDVDVDDGFSLVEFSKSDIVFNIKSFKSNLSLLRINV